MENSLSANTWEHLKVCSHVIDSALLWWLLRRKQQQFVQTSYCVSLPPLFTWLFTAALA